MPKGGVRAGAGRPPGSPNRKTRAIAERVAAEGITPLEVMMKAMRAHYDKGELDQAASIAKDAAPYMHPRLTAVDAQVGATFSMPANPVDAPPPETRDQWLARKQRELLSLVPAAGSAE